MVILVLYSFYKGGTGTSFYTMLSTYVSWLMTVPSKQRVKYSIDNMATHAACCVKSVKVETGEGSGTDRLGW